MNMKKFLWKYIYKLLQPLCDLLIANNTFPGNFKYPDDWKTKNSFGSMNMKSFYRKSCFF